MTFDPWHEDRWNNAINKAIAPYDPKDPTPEDALSRLKEFARQRNAAHPSLTEEQAFAQVWTDRNHIDLKRVVTAGQLARAQSFSLAGGDTAYQASHSGAYSNPHPPRVGSPRPGRPRRNL